LWFPACQCRASLSLSLSLSRKDGCFSCAMATSFDCSCECL